MLKEIKLGTKIIEGRQIKHITQEELAAHIGVSKAAVSKWENDLSYPDIVLLPKIAAFFNISVDELIGYEPQMSKEEIKHLYRRLAERLAAEPFEVVKEECDTVIRRYFSCYPLLNQMALLYANHFMLAKEPQKVLERAVELSHKVRMESKDVGEISEGAMIEGGCYVLLRQPEKVLELLGGDVIRPMTQETELLAQTYEIMGNIPKAKEAYQIGMYQHMLLLLGDMFCYLMLNADDLTKAQEIIKRMFDVADSFHVDTLHYNVMFSVYLTAMQVYCRHGLFEDALNLLEKYVVLVERIKRFTLHGDDFFTDIDGWFEEFQLGNLAPRSNQLIQEMLIQGVTENPAFAVLENEKRYQALIARLKKIAGGK